MLLYHLTLPSSDKYPLFDVCFPWVMGLPVKFDILWKLVCFTIYSVNYKVNHCYVTCHTDIMRHYSLPCAVCPYFSFPRKLILFDRFTLHKKYGTTCIWMTINTKYRNTSANQIHLNVNNLLKLHICTGWIGYLQRLFFSYEKWLL